MTALLAYVAGIGRALLAVPVALLPQRYWESLDLLPVRQASHASGLLTTTGGLYLGGRGLIAYLNRAADASISATFDIAARQSRGESPAGVDVTTWDLQRLSVFSFVAFVLVTPLGLFATYLVLSGLLRAVSGVFDQPIGDPLATGLDALVRRVTGRRRARRAAAARLRAEGPEVPDRLRTGGWAGLEGVDYVVVASRRKPGWTRGTFVITSDRWYTLGEPFDMKLPQGLRTIYPLTEQRVADVLRRGVPYELPPLASAAGSRAAGTARPPRG